MGLGNSKIKTQAQILSLSSGILGGDWDLRNTLGWILVFAWECFLEFQVVTEHMKLRLELPWEPSLSWLMALCKWTCKLVLVGLKMQVHSWKPRQVLLASSQVCKGCQAFPYRTSLLWMRLFFSPRTPAAFLYYKTTSRRFYFFLNTWPCCYVVQAGLEHSSWNDLSLPRAGLWVYSTPSLGHSFLSSLRCCWSAYIWVAQMFVQCSHPEVGCHILNWWHHFFFVWWPLVIKYFLPLSLVYFLWHQREKEKGCFNSGLSYQKQSLCLLLLHTSWWHWIAGLYHVSALSVCVGLWHKQRQQGHDRAQKPVAKAGIISATKGMEKYWTVTLSDWTHDQRMK